jgi:hypothetical protein
MPRAVLAALCFRQENSHPPICGIHNVALVGSRLPIDPYAPYLGRVIAYVCPVSGQVVTEVATQ